MNLHKVCLLLVQKLMNWGTNFFRQSKVVLSAVRICCYSALHVLGQKIMTMVVDLFAGSGGLGAVF